eukprot:TRINITY_DN5227_c0_g2_i1.p1 TRINITY_DN5227_c0_g2~~TRINITY_DN5227_c0_g2_i1.p1  ORF type:complete len:199 (+),score=30.99 TRINITY_DN5227_c0_g2_i1:747-1343(+)
MGNTAANGSALCCVGCMDSMIVGIVCNGTSHQSQAQVAFVDSQQIALNGVVFDNQSSLSLAVEQSQFVAVCSSSGAAISISTSQFVMLCTNNFGSVSVAATVFNYATSCLCTTAQMLGAFSVALPPAFISIPCPRHICCNTLTTIMHELPGWKLRICCGRIQCDIMSAVRHWISRQSECGDCVRKLLAWFLWQRNRRQ